MAPLGPGFTISELEVTVLLTYDAKCPCEFNSFEIFRWEGKYVILLVIQLHCKDLIKQAPGKSDQEYLLTRHNLAEQIYYLPVLMPMTVY